MPDTSYSGPFIPLSNTEQQLCRRLKSHVHFLAETIGERNIWQKANLDIAAQYIEKTFLDLGYNVSCQEFDCEGLIVKNIEAEVIGAAATKEIVIVGAHYDSVMGCPGANDNASGVSALLEIARLLSNRTPALTLRFVAFVNEEPPFFQTKYMGSRVYAIRSRQRGEQISAMICFETIGYYCDEPHSQSYPFPLGFFYPTTGNFIGFVGNMSCRNLVSNTLSSFRKNTRFPSEGAAAPGWLPGIGWSDHWAFWKEGYPAIMITDTAPFRYKYYHNPNDTPDQIEYDQMARVVMGMGHVVADLSGG